MDVVALQNYIIAEPTNIEIILEKLGFNHIRDRGKYYQFPNKNGDNMTACSILKENLHYENFSHNERGSLFTLIMSDRKCDFPSALYFTADVIGFKSNNIHITLPFGGFYKNLMKPAEIYMDDLPEYSEDKLPKQYGVSNKFFRDGIAYNVQETWGVRYDDESDSIVIPVYRYGKLVGAKARNNNPHCDDSHRWWAYLPYQKTQVLYGLDNNYNAIQNKNTAIIFESEKAVLQCDSFDLHCALALGGHSISQAQSKMLKSLMINRIILAFDEGISEDEIVFEAEKLRSDNCLYSNCIGYIYDRKNDVLQKGSKDSPSDHGAEVFKKLMKDNVRYLHAKNR